MSDDLFYRPVKMITSLPDDKMSSALRAYVEMEVCRKSAHLDKAGNSFS